MLIFCTCKVDTFGKREKNGYKLRARSERWTLIFKIVTKLSIIVKKRKKKNFESLE